MKPINNKTIAIVGGGPGGLTLARLLQMNGAHVKVYERDVNKDVRVQGATLDLHDESGLAALRAAGLMDAFMQNYRPGADKLCITDKHATPLMQEWDSNQTGDPAHFRPEIDRGPLRNILMHALQPGTIVWNSQFVSMQPAENGWSLTFKNGTTASADIVIAADGANSKIRPLITPIKPFFSGISSVEGAVYDAANNTPRIHKLLNGGKIFSLSDEKTLIVSAKGDGSLVFYTSGKTNESYLRDLGIDFNNKTQVIEWFKKEYAGWDEIWLELFENAEPHFIPRAMYCMPLDQQWEPLPNLTMLGDAAHLMPPYAGEGVNMAMLDALELSNCLLDEIYPNVHSAIAAYEKQMLARASETAAMTLAQTESMHAENGLRNMLAMFEQAQ